MERAYLVGAFRAEGGSNDIRTLVLDADGWINFSNGNDFRDYYDSGDATIDKFRIGPLAAGTYYVVFSNAAILTNKVVETDMRLIWYQ